MSKEKQKGARKSSLAKPPAKPQLPAQPPPDDPLLRHEASEAEYPTTIKEMAEKRLAALKKTREMPSEEEGQSAKNRD